MAMNKGLQPCRSKLSNSAILPNPLGHSPSVAMDDQKICDDLLLEIFLRLPFEAIFKFKCLSKKWNHIFSTERFRDDYESRQRGEDLFLLSGVFIGFDPYVPSSEKPRISFVPTCLQSMPIRSRKFITNGELVCIAGSNDVILCVNCRCNSYFICNPIKDRWFELPPPPNRKLECLTDAVVGLLYEECIKEDGSMHPTFTVVRADRRFRIETYSSDIGVWKQIKLSRRNLPGHISLDTQGCCQVAGSTFYWRAKTLPGLFQGGWLLVAYSPKAQDDKVWLMHVHFLENWPYENDPDGEMVVTESSDGNLQYAVCFDDFFRIYRLKKKLRSYSYETTVPLCDSILILQQNIQYLTHELRPLSIIAFHPQNSRFLLVRYAEDIYFYDAELGELTQIWRLGIPLGDRAKLLPFYQRVWPPLL